jgi:two-component system response regulator NreC
VSIRILLVDDHGIMRSGLRALLQAESDVEVVGEAEDGRQALRMVAELSPDVVIMDLRMPDLNGIEATYLVLAAKPDAKIIALSANSDHRSVIDMLRAGAKGYVIKDAAFGQLSDAIHAVVKNRVYLSPSITDVLVSDFIQGNSSGKASVFDILSPREREIIQLIAEGNATKEIAAKLHLSIKTAETHRRNMMEKLGMESVAELTKYAIREGLASL